MMLDRMVFLTAFFFIIMAAMPFEAVSQHHLSCKIEGIKKPEGSLYVALYNHQDNYKYQDSIWIKKILPLDSTNVTIEYDHLPKGHYAITLFQDKNNDGKLNKNLVGYPKEPFGFSNNPRILFKKPGWNDCRFSVRQDTMLVIKI